ncbi:tyrosine-type recombinase/integrase [Crossiella cryophila]|uniref:Site-specific recombinase XerD n=1 Tax=Crossiella cryophila TaxID=43355 RepID=A0A7W7CE70_9PSEU|nr:site-specific integrase [Crossiella cryophila]MBB4679470.1 site-specific recombinase XerD [Crossiella cryophila]
MHTDLDTARLLLARLGVRAEELLAEPAPTAPMPLIREYLPRVANAVPVGTRRAYQPYWQRIITAWGERRLDEPTPLEIKQLAEQVKANAVPRRNSRGGRSAAEHLIGALRCLYRHAVNDELIDERDNPALRVAKPRRLASTRRALPAARLAEINEVTATTGNDPELDTLILRLHTETACRRGGALDLRPQDLDETQCLIYLREKGETARWQPVSPTLMTHLLRHAEDRGAPPEGRLLRYTNGQPITTRRYDHLWQRLGRHLPWVATQQVSTHWLRHTTLTFVERNFGYGVARAFAGHEGKSDAGTTTTYIRAELEEVAAALAALTGEPHPLTPLPV